MKDSARNPSPSGRRWREAPDEGSQGQARAGEDRVDDAPALPQDVVVPEAQDRPPVRRQPSVAPLVALALGVLPTIGLDEEPLLDAQKVDDVGSDGNLPPELEAAQ